MPAPTVSSDSGATLRVFLAVCAGVLALRIAGLTLSPLELHFDEAQYWAWSRSFDFGYFSKPPLVAWAIGTTTGIFGHEEWAVRLAAPIAHTLGAIALYALAQRIYGATAALWTGVLWLTMPAVWVSSAIMSTDALMLPLWSLGLYALWRMTEDKSFGWAVLLGACIGFGALAKYAMLYFFLCAGIAAIISKPVRTALISLQGALALAVATVVFAPNVVWNATHEFRTVAHTAANANLDGPLVHPEELFEFVAGQAGVMGPVLFAALIVFAVLRLAKPKALTEADKFLLAFAMPPLILILGQALISRAHANWAAAAYPAAVTWVVGQILATRGGGVRTRIAALATQLALGAVVAAVGIAPQIADSLHISNALKRNRGWAETVQAIAAQARATNAELIIVDHRALYYELAYYGRGLDLPPVKMWLLNAAPLNQAEAEAPLTSEDQALALFVHLVPQYTPLTATDFVQFGPRGGESIALGNAGTRDLEFSAVQGFAPAPRDDAFRARLAASRAAPPESGSDE